MFFFSFIKYDYENLIPPSFRELYKLYIDIYRFAGIRRVLMELEADNWKHRSNYTVTLNCWHFSASSSYTKRLL